MSAYDNGFKQDFENSSVCVCVHFDRLCFKEMQLHLQQAGYFDTESQGWGWRDAKGVTQTCRRLKDSLCY
jgi:hypothetical protein